MCTTNGAVTCSPSTIFWVLAIALTFSSSAARTREGEREFKDLPLCERNTVCGYVQLNRRGVSSIELCRCPDESCPLIWDLMDGRTIAHGNDQYKYCSSSPQLELCNTHDTVYSSYVEMSALTGQTLISNIYVHCVCPPTYLFTPNNTVFHQYQNGIMAIRTSYLCKPPPLCGLGDTCMAITETYSDENSFVTRKCACPLGYFCPNDIRLSWQREVMDKGVFYKMQCL
ncbi:uncharacterized protein LOC111623746 [Centruroides sculpturatus]|uniref:uncharacterized protein LOC111623746 n=1 Tax=Centruroides sculpturatus TaxID=218467 RepID=UPI000C6E7343|nr:uncharacterized protein LOC111623746 [Centruroides sculpturatus]XP_023222212.1 uncharacterized protein LOC111623746 [Centruroides sculpturatus]